MDSKSDLALVDRPIVADRLVLARQRSELTKTAVANEIRLSPRAYGRFESGEAEPQPAELEEIAELLDVSTSYFFFESAGPLEVEAVSFRKRSKTSRKRQDAALAFGHRVEEAFASLRGQFSLPPNKLPDLDASDPEAAARIIRRDWGLGERPITNILALVESKGVRVVSLPGGWDDVDAYCFSRDGESFVLLNTEKTAERVNFDIAHELGHLILHRNEDFITSQTKMREDEANRFAAEFLMPRARVLQQGLRSATVDDVIKAKQYWRVSAMAMAFRLKTLHLATDWQYRSLVIELTGRGYRNSEPNGSVLPNSQLWMQVIYGKVRRKSAKEIADSLGLSVREIKTMLRGLIPVVI